MVVSLASGSPIHLLVQASLVDADGQLDLERLIQKLGLKGTGEARLLAFEGFAMLGGAQPSP